MNIIIGITGGIAAYKIPMLIRLFKQAGHEVQCVATDHALQFVTRLTIETLSGRRLYSGLFEESNERSTEHIALKEWGDVLLIAPATANIIAKMANGIADDALSTLTLSFTGTTKPVYICPAMNTQMLEAPATRRNIEQLRKDGITIIESGCGELACGAVGNGRMAEPEEIYNKVIPCKIEPLKGKKYLITAGPTYERFDAVRFIGNYSSGKMGYAIAESIAEKGGDVVLISGPTHIESKHSRINTIRVESAREMYATAIEHFPHCDGAILTAAVADYRPKTQTDHKIKKKGDEGLTIELIQNPDILATLGSMKKEWQLLIGFALETDNELANAQKKLSKKNLDYIIMNSLNDRGAGFGVDTNKVTIIRRDGSVTEGSLKSKKEVAEDIVALLK